jgi:Family of unknown function (DUF6331)
MKQTLEPARKVVLPQPLLDLVGACCAVCVPECCGVDAYEVSTKHMMPWLAKNGIAAGEKASDQLDHLIDWASTQSGELWSDGSEFNAIWHPQACINYLQQWRRELVRALTLAASAPN